MPYKPKIVTRDLSISTVSTDSIPKNAALSNNDMDSNLLNLRDASIGIASDDSTTIDIGLGNTLKVIGAGGVTTAVSGQSITIDGSGISGGVTNSFSTIAVAGQSNVVADSTTDTLTLAAGTGITLTTNAGTDTVTITSSISTGDLSISGTTITNSSGTTIGFQGSSGGAEDLVFRDIVAYDSTYHGGIGPSDYISTGGIINAITCAGDLLLGAGYTNQAGTEDSTNNIVLDARITRLYGDDTQAILTTAQDKDLILSSFDLNGNNDEYEPFIKLHGQPHGTTGRYGDIELKPARELGGGGAQNPDGAVILDELYVRANMISTESSNADIVLQCHGTGSVVIDSISIKDNTISNNASDSDIQIKSAGTGTVDFSVPTATTIGANGAASALTANPVGYLKIKINGTTYQLPYYNV